MHSAWLTARYLAEQTRMRLRTVLKVDSELGALTLEWIIIAVGVAVAAVAAGVVFTNAINKYAGKLP